VTAVCNVPREYRKVYIRYTGRTSQTKHKKFSTCILASDVKFTLTECSTQSGNHILIIIIIIIIIIITGK
jgi:hypothetical protein